MTAIVQRGLIVKVAPLVGAWIEILVSHIRKGC